MADRTSAPRLTVRDLVLETLTMMLVVFALSLLALSLARGAQAAPTPSAVRLDLTLVSECGRGYAQYRDARGESWVWTGSLQPGADCQAV
jgi:hypothetical protein